MRYEEKVLLIRDFIISRAKAHKYGEPPGNLEVIEELDLQPHEMPLMDEAYDLYYDSIIDAAEERMRSTEVNKNEAFVNMCIAQLTNHLEMQGIDPSTLQVVDMQVNYQPQQAAETVRVTVNLKEEK